MLERRHLTVLFCDLVDSTRLFTLLDPESLADIIFAFRQLMQAEVASFGGTIAQYIGDGVLAYFGYPEARDDDPARAVEAALAMLAGMPALRSRFDARLKAPLQIRIGLDSGLAVIEAKDRIGIGLGSVGALGQTLNIAARLQAQAPPGTALASSAVHVLTANAFEYEAKGEVMLKGLPDPVQVFRPVRRWAARRGQPGLAPRQIQGRASEMGRLHGFWAAAREGRGGTAFLAADPGMGKTVLANWMAGQVKPDGGLVIRLWCRFDATQSPFRTVLDGLQRHLLLAKGSAEEKGRRLRRVLRRGGAVGDELSTLLCEFLELPMPAGVAAPRLTREGRLRRLRDFLLDWLLQLARGRPILVVVENVHWADPSSEQWMAELARRAPDGRILVLATTRQRLPPAWAGTMFLDTITLDRLDPASQGRMLAALEAGRQIGPGLQTAVLERADGVPLFLEELFKTVSEGAALGDAGLGSTIPGALRSLLTARLDRLGPAKRIALAAAVIGRSFSLDMLRTLCAVRPRELEQGLAALVEKDILHPQPDRTAAYSFKHALLRDAAYDALLTTERKELHAKLARIYPRQAPDVVEHQPEVVAQHASLGGLRGEAVALWRRAGRRALDRSAYREAMSHLRRALAEAEELPGTPVSRLCTELATAAMGAEGLAAPEVGRLSLRAYQLCTDAADGTDLLAAMASLASYYQVRGPLHRALELTERMAAMAQEQGDPNLLIMANRRLGWCRLCLGDAAGSRVLLASVIRDYEARPETGRLSMLDTDSMVLAYVNLAWAEALAGNTARAAELCEASIALATRLGERPTDMAYALCMSAAAHQAMGNQDAALALATHAFELSSQNALPYWQAWSTTLTGWASIPRDPREATRTILRGLVAYRATGARLFVPYGLGLAAEACRALGRIRLGLLFLDRADAETLRTGARFSEPGLALIRARLLRSAGREDEAAAADDRAATLGRSQGSLLFVHARTWSVVA